MPFLKGILTGIVLMFMLGPSFFYLIRVAILQGFKKALGFASGIILSDLFMIVPIFFGLRKVFESQDFQVAFGVVASVVMLFLGVKYLRTEKEQPFQLPEGQEAHENDGVGFVGFMIKGFSINIINPFTVMLWLSVPGFVDLGNGVQEVALFVSALGITILTLDCLKAFLANKLANLLNERTLLLVDKVLGIVLLGFSVWYAYKTALHWDVIVGWFHV